MSVNLAEGSETEMIQSLTGHAQNVEILKGGGARAINCENAM